MKKQTNKLKNTFNKIPADYDKYRLNYPDQVYKTILKYCPLSPTDKILEIGIGSGLATKQFARLGNKITAIDLSPELIKIARKKLKNSNSTIKFIARPYENAKLPENYFRLVYAGQAFHWIDPDIRLKKTHKLLTENGCLAVFWNMHNYKKPGTGKDTKKLFIRYGLKPVKKHNSNDVFNDLKKSKLFENFKYLEIPWVLKVSKKDRVNLVMTYSQVLNMPYEKRRQFKKDLEDSLKKFKNQLNVQIITKLAMVTKKD